MKYVFPSYYKKFRCIGGKCAHNCCVADWEIDIDDDTFEFYKSIDGEIGQKLQKNIATNPTPHFIFKNGRCPFLNEENLCELIVAFGDDALCDICYEHPRFYNEIDDRLEAGVGLCCEEAGRLILGFEKPMTLECDESLESENKLLILREKVFCILQNRDKNITARIDEMLSVFSLETPEFDVQKWASFLLSLERLEEKWTVLLEDLEENCKNADFIKFDEYMYDRQSEFEQLITYFIYRHFANSEDENDAVLRVLFAFFGYQIIRALGAVEFSKTGEFSFETLVEFSRLFSSEIEYSEENFAKILNALNSYNQ